MSVDTLHRQVGRRGLVLCHYRSCIRRPGYKLSRTSHGLLLTFGAAEHCLAIGWMKD
jgi:hypothetical protein